MKRDPLAVLARLRALEVDAARRELSERLGALRDAELAHDAAQARLPLEATAAAPQDYAAWLPRGLRERDAAERAQDLATQRAETARSLLARARADTRAVERVQESRAAARALRRDRGEQALLDEAAARRGR